MALRFKKPVEQEIVEVNNKIVHVNPAYPMK